MKFSTVSAIVTANIKAWLLRTLGRKHEIIPYKILLQTTNDCNSRCETCHIWKINKESPELREQELSLLQVENILKDLNSSLIWLAFSGGEVTLHEETKEMVRLAKRYCPNLKFVTFTTNGILPKKAFELAKCIKEENLDCFVTISLDGDEETHDKLRGISGNFKLAFETYELIKSLNIVTHFGITLSEENHNFIINDFEKYQDQIRAITFVHGSGIYNKSAVVDDKKIISSLRHIYKNYRLHSISDIVEKLHIRLAIKFLELQRKVNPIPCDAGYSSLHIFPRGEVSPCMYLPPVGNIKDKNLNSILSSKAYQDSRIDASQGRCSKCWMNCYSPHSIMQSPIKTLWQALKTKVAP